MPSSGRGLATTLLFDFGQVTMQNEGSAHPIVLSSQKNIHGFVMRLIT